MTFPSGFVFALGWGPLAVVGLVAVGSLPLSAQATRAERSGAGETSSYADVRLFLDSLLAAGAELRVVTLATSTEGRPIPWVLAARPMVDDPPAAHRSGKPIVYLQANIHAGEVEGKEVAQMLLRDLTLGALRPLLDSVILLVVPMYNPDGNERVGPSSLHRPNQSGPARVGRRANGQGLDLNRDYVKLEAPETRGAVALLQDWDPDFFIDLHTTNGSYHGYGLTYAPGLNPNSGPANAYIQDEFLPAIRDRIRARHNHSIFPYGNFRNQDPDSLTQGWYTYDPRPRFGTNWFALRGRMAILSEAYSHASFQDRIHVTYAFVREILSLAAEQRTRIASLRAASDRWRPDSLSLRADYAAPRVETIVAEVTLSDGDGSHGFARRTRTGQFRSIRIPVYDRFAPKRVEAMPHGYFLGPHLTDVARLLRRHGVRVARLREGWHGAMETFRVDSVLAQATPFEGHRLVRVEGTWVAEQGSVPRGWYFVPTAQRLGVLAAYLLEPAAADGVAAWNLLDRDLRTGAHLSILRVRQRPETPMVELSYEE